MADFPSVLVGLCHSIRSPLVLRLSIAFWFWLFERWGSRHFPGYSHSCVCVRLCAFFISALPLRHFRSFFTYFYAGETMTTRARVCVFGKMKTRLFCRGLQFIFHVTSSLGSLVARICFKAFGNPFRNYIFAPSHALVYAFLALFCQLQCCQYFQQWDEPFTLSVSPETLSSIRTQKESCMDAVKSDYNRIAIMCRKLVLIFRTTDFKCA